MGLSFAVDWSTIRLASCFGSRGRLPLPMAIYPSFHNIDAKASLWKTKLTHYQKIGPLAKFHGNLQLIYAPKRTIEA